MAKVKAKDILSTFTSGFGCMNEQEVVVMGGANGSAMVLKGRGISEG